MQSGINKEQVQPYFQPILSVDKGKVFAYEILGRICTPDKVTSLGPFFHNPNILHHEKVSIDRLVRFKALELFKQEKRNELLFINIQPQWLLPFQSTSYLPTLEELHRIGMEGSQVVIEICEEDFEDENNVLIDLTQRYREAGCKIAIDDFGKKFNSLDRIIILRPDYLKVGTKTIRNDSYPEIGQYMMQSIGMLCEKTGTSLILEEVETMDHFLMGLDAGVRFFQGELFAEPSPDFLDPEFGYKLIEKGLQNYIDSKSEQQLNIIKFTNHMDIFIKLAIDKTPIDMYNIEAFLTKLTASAPESWSRIYVCNCSGYQVTPNYSRRFQHDWEWEPQYQGRNWCWRPYFLQRVIEARHNGRGTLSQPYIDLESRQTIWTFVFSLTQELFLFIDLNPTIEI
jgi:EAL domain-containing protein (putative c-di-GMP-specific phosphodiesterase class I)